MNTIAFILIASVWCVSVEAIGVGDYVSITDVPYYVALDDRLYKLLNVTFCGGAILSEQWIVTAAHCSRDMKLEPMRIRTGGTTQAGKGNVHDVAKIIIHPDYEYSINELEYLISHNDIALLKLATPISFNKYQQPISISSKPPEINDTMTVMGLGIEAVKADTPSLKKTEMRVAVEKHITQWLPTKFIVEDEDSQGCSGDSGGPVVKDGKIFGVQSMGIKCRSLESRFKDKFNFITSIHLYYDWISQHTGIKF